MAGFPIWFGVSNTCSGMWLNGVGQNRESNEEHNEDCIEDGFQLARVKCGKDGARGREALGMGNCNSNVWDGS